MSLFRSAGDRGCPPGAVSLHPLRSLSPSVGPSARLVVLSPIASNEYDVGPYVPGGIPV